MHRVVLRQTPLLSLQPRAAKLRRCWHSWAETLVA
jgi:hypothetical protein